MNPDSTYYLSAPFHYQPDPYTRGLGRARPTTTRTRARSRSHSATLALGQHRLRAADARRRPGQGRRRWRTSSACVRRSRPRRYVPSIGLGVDRGLAARHGLRVRDARRGRDLLEADGDHARSSSPTARRTTDAGWGKPQRQRVISRRRRVRGDEDPRGEHAGGHRRRRVLRPARRRQDGDDRQPRRRLVLAATRRSSRRRSGSATRRAEIPMQNVHGIAVAGGTFPATIWKLFMETALGHDAGARVGPRRRDPGRLASRARTGSTAASLRPTTELLLRRRPRPAARRRPGRRPPPRPPPRVARSPPRPPSRPPPPPPSRRRRRRRSRRLRRRRAAAASAIRRRRRSLALAGAARRARRVRGLSRRLRRARRRPLPRGAVPRRPHLPGLRRAAACTASLPVPRRLRRVPAGRVRGVPAADRPLGAGALQRALQDADGALRRRDARRSSRSCWPTLGASLHARSASASALLALSPIALGPISLNTYDAWPACLTVLALWLLAARLRSCRRSAVLGLAIDARRSIRSCSSPLAAWLRLAPRGLAGGRRCALGVLVLVARGGRRCRSRPTRRTASADSFHSQAARGLQVESLGASLLLVLDRLGVYHARGRRDDGRGRPRPRPARTADAVAAVAARARRRLAVATVWFAVRAAAREPARAVCRSPSPLRVAGFLAFTKRLLAAVPRLAAAARASLAAARSRSRSTRSRSCSRRSGSSTTARSSALEWPVWLLFARDLTMVALYLVLAAELARWKTSTPSRSKTSRHAGLRRSQDELRRRSASGASRSA